MLIGVAIIVGLLVYALTMRSGKLRRTRTYIGGERLNDVYISGSNPGPTRHLEVTGVHFYDTIEQLPVIQRMFRLSRARTFDLYELLKRGTGYIVIMLRSLHSGVLPAYLRWFIVGLLVVVWVVTQPGS